MIAGNGKYNTENVNIFRILLGNNILLCKEYDTECQFRYINLKKKLSENFPELCGHTAKPREEIIKNRYKKYFVSQLPIWKARKKKNLLSTLVNQTESILEKTEIIYKLLKYYLFILKIVPCDLFLNWKKWLLDENTSK